MQITITPTNLSPFTATAETQGLSAPITLAFSLRSGSTTSIISTLPKALRELGSATNLSIPLKEFIVGTPIVRESVQGATHVGSISGGVYKELEAKVAEDGKLTLFNMAKDGTQVTRLTSDDPDLAYAYAVADAFGKWVKDAGAYALGAEKAYSDNAETARKALKAMGNSDEAIEEMLRKNKPEAPKFELPKRAKKA